jgi:hypothetical protein
MVSNPADELTQGWPDEPDNDELIRFAAELRAARPDLPPEALQRVEQVWQRELAAERQPRRLRLLYTGLAAAVLLAMALGAYLYLSRPQAPGVGPVAETPPGVKDRYTVELPPPPLPLTVERALVRIEDHRSLFAD